MLVRIALAVVGLALLGLAADHLVLGSSRLATRFRISSVAVGVLVIGLGSSAPEFLVSGLAAARGDTGIAVGNLVGSNIFNLTLILGLVGLLGSVTVTSAAVRREVPLAVTAVLLFAVFAWLGLSRVTGTVLGVVAVVVVVVLLRGSGRGSGDRVLAEEVDEFTGSPAPVDVSVPPSRLPGWFEPVRTVVALGGVLAGAQLLVANAAGIAAGLGVSQVVIGFTLVAVGTSVPELVTAAAAQRRGERELVVGNLFGSNLFNSLIGGAIVGVASGRASASAGTALLAAMVLSCGLAWALLRRGLVLTRVEGAALVAVYGLTLPVVLSS